MTKEKETKKEIEKNGIEVLREKMLRLEEILNKIVIGYEDVIKCVLISIVAKEHAVLISKPGMAKSYLFHNLFKLIDCNFYCYLLTKTTDDSELIGIPNIKKIIENGIYERNWSNIINADFVFLDEIFKANSIILNALLSMMNERIVFDAKSGQIIPVKLISLFGASNEIPEDDDLIAFYDRFVFHIFLEEKCDIDILSRIIDAKYKNKVNISHKIISVNEIRQLNNYCEKALTIEIANNITLIDVYKKECLPILVELKQKGLDLSRRTIVEKIPKLISAYCILYGFTVENIVNSIFELLPYIIKYPEDKQIINEFMNSTFKEINEYYEKLKKAKNAYKSKNFELAKELLKEILNFDLSNIAHRPFLLERMKVIMSEAEKMLNKIAQIEKMLEESYNE